METLNCRIRGRLDEQRTYCRCLSHCPCQHIEGNGDLTDGYTYKDQPLAIRQTRKMCPIVCIPARAITFNLTQNYVPVRLQQ